MDIILKPIMKAVKKNGFELEAHIRKTECFLCFGLYYTTMKTINAKNITMH